MGEHPIWCGEATGTGVGGDMSTNMANDHAAVAEQIGQHQYSEMSLFHALCLVQEQCPAGWAADAITSHHTSLLSEEAVEVGSLRQGEHTITLYAVRFGAWKPRPK
jgi:hypothetical protein